MRPPGRGRIVRWPAGLELEDGLVLSAVLALPWAFGGVEMWAFRSAALLLVAGGAVALVKHGPEGLGLDRKALWLMPALLLGLWGVIQVIPMPPPVIEVLSPTAHELYRDTFPGYPGPAPEDLAEAIELHALGRVPEAADVPQPTREVEAFERRVAGSWSRWRPLSLLPSVGVERIHWYFALLVGFLVVRRRCFDPEVGRLYLRALFVFFSVLAVFGLVYAATSNGKLYWVRSTLEFSRPFGPYVNPNNFAGVMELGTPWIVGYTLMNLREWGRVSWLELRTPIFVAGALLCIAADIATASKSSPVLLAVCLVLLALAAMRGFYSRLAVLLGSAALATGTGLLLRQTTLADRVRDYLDIIGGDPTQSGRVLAWRSMGAMLRDYLGTGTGFGSFRDAVPRYMHSGDHQRWLQAHNDYLEVLIEGGAVAGVLLLWLMWGFWSRVLRPSLLRAEGRWNLEALGLVLGVAMLSFHALFDFNHQIPANALLFVTLAAIAVARADRPEAAEESPS